MELDLLPRAQCTDILETARKEAASHGVSDVEVTIMAGSEALTRFANNGIHQNVAERSQLVSIRCMEGHRTARAETNRVDAASIRRSAQQAISILRAQQPDENLPALLEPQEYRQVHRWVESTARCSPAARATLVGEAIELARQQRLTAAGILSTGESVEALLSSTGLFCYHPQTSATFSITAMDDDSSGWAKESSIDLGALDVPGLAARAVDKAVRSRHPQELPPGAYTVVLEPAAVLDLVGQMFPDFSGTSIEDQQSFLTGRLGEKLFGANITITDDVYHLLQAGPAFDGEGVPRQRLQLVDKGVAAEVAWSRIAAARNSKQPTGHGLPLPNEAGEIPLNLVIAGGDASVEKMIASTPRGILVTRLWYIREVEPFAKLMTGMTRDGTFLIQGGEVTTGLRNFRFNQGIVDLLGKVESLGQAVRASGEEAFDMVCPAMKVADFNFSEVTKF